MSQIKRLLIGIFLLLVLADASAQCPVANSCTPGSAPAAVFPFGMGIYNVSVGSGATGITNPTTSGAPAGYQDFSCTQKATILEGVSTAITVATNPNSDENVRVWIDLNNNGTFEPATELVFSSNNSRTHTGNFTIPISATIIKNQVLRLRVSSDDNGSPIPTPCSTPKFGQVEDYGITILPNLNKPATDFTVNKTITCSPTVQFTNLVQNNPTTYLWLFGDGTTSTQANPTKTYPSPGNYTVTLISCNPMGCDSLVKTNYITYHTNIPVTPSCTPATTSYCCGYGINNFSLHTLTNNSQVGNGGYEDFTCEKLVYLMEDNTYPVSVSSVAANLQDVWVYIDYDNDGNFSANELVFTKTGVLNPSGFITIKNGVVKKRPLRLRVIADAQGAPPGPCANRTNGQVEDYSVIIQQNSNKPKAAFSSDYNSICDTLVSFTDKSQNAPTSWLWNFGDGNYSIQQHPQHLYATNGIYNVSLVSCNQNGCDTLVKKQNIYIRKPCPQYCIPLYNNSSSAVMYVNFNTIINSTGIDTSGYHDYTHLSTNVIKGSTYSFSSSTNVYNSRIHAWIDFNQDGDFDDPGEMVVSVAAAINITRNIKIPVSARSGPTRMRVAAVGVGKILGTACLSNTDAEYEDYTVNILPNNQPPTALFTSFNQQSCGNRISFADTSANSPLSWRWDFGDPGSGAANVSTEERPTHLYSRLGTYTVRLKVCNDYGCDSLTKVKYVNVIGTQGLRPVNCKPISTSTNPNDKMGIYNVIFNTINNSSPAGNGYEDYSCTHQTIVEQGGAYALTINTGDHSKSDVMVWIDFNDDGVFDQTAERVLVSSNKFLHTGSIAIPMTTVLNTPIRLRIMSSSYLSLQLTGPCTPVGLGQVEDYAITIVPATGKPVAAFKPSSFSSCDPLITFTDRSTTSPTSWSWDFGDFASGTANFSNQQNPTHTFSSWGNFAVTLTACNAAGCHTYRQIVTVMGNPISKAACAVSSLPNLYGEGIYNVKFLNVDHSSANSSEGPRDFSCWGNTVTPPGSFLLTVQTNPNRYENANAFIDFNNDGYFSGQFEKVELTGGVGVKTGIIVVPLNAVKWKWLRFRIVDADMSTFGAGPCQLNHLGQAEDYALMIVDRIDLITDIMAVKEPKEHFSQQLKVYPNPSKGTFSLEFPTVFKGDLQLEVQNLIGQKVAVKTINASGKTIPVDLSHLPKGLYLLQASDGTYRAMKKILIE